MAELPRPLKFASFLQYVKTKYAHDTLREGYFFDCQWTGATGFQFNESDAPQKTPEHQTRATLPRWSEVISGDWQRNKQEEVKAGQMTKEDIKQRLITLKTSLKTV